MNRIKLTQGKYAIVDDDMFDEINRHKWYYLKAKSSRGYAVRSKKPNGKTKILFMHKAINQTPDGMQTDHINGDKLDNRKENLRSCTQSENLYNQDKHKNNTTGFKGVFYDEGKYIRASIGHNNKLIYLGRYKTIEDGARAYNEAAIKYHGEFALLNEIV